MRNFLIFNFLFFLFYISHSSAEHSKKEIFCYYDSDTYFREKSTKAPFLKKLTSKPHKCAWWENRSNKIIGSLFKPGQDKWPEGIQARALVEDLDPAMAQCMYLIYGYAGVSSSDFTITSLNASFDMTAGSGNYRKITNLKLKFPTVKVLLSVGGGVDNDDPEKYMRLLESTMARNAFVQSAKTLLRNNNFDGINIAWQFPLIKPKRIRTSLGHFWHGVKKTLGIKKLVDPKFNEHREQFTHLIMELKEALEEDGLLLTSSVLPNVNSSEYFDTYALKNQLDYVILHGYDYSMPDRNPKEADYASPLYELPDRNPKWNINHLVTHWLSHDFPADKIILGMATFGRAWKLTAGSDSSGVPPICTDGPAAEGPYTRRKGLFSYTEMCVKFMGHEDSTRADPDFHFRKVQDETNKRGIYAYRHADRIGERGMWVSYEDRESIAQKSILAKKYNLAGIAIVDLTLDDFKGICHNQKFPLLNAATSAFWT